MVLFRIHWLPLLAAIGSAFAEENSLLDSSVTDARSFDPARTKNQCASVNADGVYSADYACNSLMMPQVWQKPIQGGTEDDADYDLVIIGGGIGAMYLVNRLLLSFEANNQEPPKIALYERSDRIGGRLVSGYGSGSLGLSVIPKTVNDDLSDALPLQEYGGMRVDPYKYPLTFNKVIEMGKKVYGEDKCLSQDELAELGRPRDNGCPAMFVRMQVGQVRYANYGTNLGILDSSTVKTKTERKYCESDIATNAGSPFDNCIQLALAANKYWLKQPGGAGTRDFKTGMDEACKDCKNGMEGFCDLCKKFEPNYAPAVISCSGYDQPSSMAFGFMISLLNEVVDVEETTHLYLIRGGYQRFAQGLGQSTVGQVAPQFGRTMTGISVKGASSTQDLATAQSAKISDPVDYDTVPDSQTIVNTFDDGSSVTSRATYMTMLPYDLAATEGMQPWEETLKKTLRPALASKIVLGWKDKAKAPPAILNTTSCVQGECQRYIFDGDSNTGWMLRQFWLWDANTIMIYDVGDVNTNEVKYPATNIQEIAKKEGMDALMKIIMTQLRNVTGIDIEDPDWARLQPWTSGNLNFWLDETTASQTASALARPLGLSNPVFYGNSEAAGNPELHGWAEGALQQVENNLPALAKYLGLKGDIIPADKSGYMANNTKILEELHVKTCSGDKTSSSLPKPTTDGTVSMTGANEVLADDSGSAARDIKVLALIVAAMLPVFLA